MNYDTVVLEKDSSTLEQNMDSIHCLSLPSNFLHNNFYKFRPLCSRTNLYLSFLCQLIFHQLFNLFPINNHFKYSSSSIPRVQTGLYLLCGEYNVLLYLHLQPSKSSSFNFFKNKIPKSKVTFNPLHQRTILTVPSF